MSISSSARLLKARISGIYPEYFLLWISKFSLSIQPNTLYPGISMSHPWVPNTPLAFHRVTANQKNIFTRGGDAVFQVAWTPETRVAFDGKLSWSGTVLSDFWDGTTLFSV
jgi:hypothetical protein